MEQIGELVRQQQKELQTQRETSLTSSSTIEPGAKLEAAVLKKFGRQGALTLSKYNPDFLHREKLPPENCHFGNYPTLAELDAHFNGRFSAAWLMAQLHDLSEYCGCKEKLTGHPLRQCASIIATSYYYLKVTELMLFFNRFKEGRYGRFYGAVDPLVITIALRDFIRERDAALRKRESEEYEKRMEEHKKHAITYEQYLEMKKKGEL